MSDLLAPLALTGRGFLFALSIAGSIAMFGARGISHLFRPPFYARLFVRSFIEFAYFSLPVVAMTAIFSGMVIALQSYAGFAKYGATSAIANIVVISVVRELAPVLAGLMVAGATSRSIPSSTRLSPNCLTSPRMRIFGSAFIARRTVL